MASRGGSREGAGRPAKGGARIMIRLPHEDIKLVKDTADELGMTPGEVVHHMVEAYKENSEGGV